MSAVKLAANKQRYHAGVGAVNWRAQNGVEGKLLGIELEVESHEGHRFEDVLRALPEHDLAVDGPAPHFEADASLDPVRGVEIIFPPYPVAQLRRGETFFNKATHALNASGLVCFDSGMCGMHVNINVGGWSDRKKAVYVAVINNMPSAIIKKLGGRKLNRYCAAHPGRGMDYYLTEPGPTHRSMIEYKRGGGRLEARFPAATLDPVVIARLAHFFDILEDYAGAMVANWDRLTGEEHWENFVENLINSHDGEANALGTYLDRP